MSARAWRGGRRPIRLTVRCLLSAAGLAQMFSVDGADVPAAKVVFQGMDAMFHEKKPPWNVWSAWSRGMAPFWGADFVYDFVYPFNKTRGLHAWFRGEHTAYNEAFPDYHSSVMIAAGSDTGVTCTAYHLVHWAGAFAGVPAPPTKPVVRVRDLDFYTIRDGRIAYNWCMIDVVDILQQGGYRVLPPAPLPDEGYPPPSAMDGWPAPDSAFVDSTHTARAAAAFQDMLDELASTAAPAPRPWWAEDFIWYGPAGIGTAKGRAQYDAHFLRPLHTAFTGLELAVDSFVCEGPYCGAHLHLTGVHAGAWLGQAATRRQVSLRFGIHARVSIAQEGDRADDVVAQAWAQLDIPEAFAQMGIDLFARARAQVLRASSGTARDAEDASPHSAASVEQLEAGPDLRELRFLGLAGLTICLMLASAAAGARCAGRGRHHLGDPYLPLASH